MLASLGQIEAHQGSAGMMQTNHRRPGEAGGAALAGRLISSADYADYTDFVQGFK
jgi:hypothetical protein